MEQNLDFPLSPKELAANLGISPRTLERSCAQHFGQAAWFGAGWLAYLAHVRVNAEPALDDVVAHADVAWWR